VSLKSAVVGITLLFSNCLAGAVTPRDFGAKGDVITLRDGTMTGGSPSFRSPTATFTRADVGKSIVVTGASAGGAALITTIQQVVSAKEVTLAANAEASVDGALVYYGSDDAAAIRSCVYDGTAKGGTCTISDGATFIISNKKSTISPFSAGHNPIQKGIIDGHGKIIFAPQEPLTGGTNDRLFYLSSQETHPMQIATAIAKGATSFTASDASEAATLSPGDWVIITERDSKVRDNVFADWMQVADVQGAVVNTTKAFRTPFPNARGWEGGPDYWGLGFRKVGPITSNITIRDVTIIIPRIKGTHAVLGIGTRDTRGTTISNITCQDASGNCFAGYMDQGLTFRDSIINGTVYTEFASEVDTTISSNQVNLAGTEFSLLGPATSGGLEIDFGTGFSSITGNSIGRTKQACLMLFAGIHDTVVTGNSCGLVAFGSASTCVLCRSCYRVSISGNTCSGGAQRSTGIDVGDAALKAPLYSEGNQIFNNHIQGFSARTSCVGKLRKDNCQQ